MTSVSLDRIAQAFGMDAPKESDSHQYATVDSINADGSYQVQMNGATNTVRAAKLCNAEIGDRVMCVVHGGQCAAIGRVGGELPPPSPTLHEGTITKVYNSNGFALEKTKFYEYDGVVTIPLQFTATTAFSGNGTTVAASIPADYAPPDDIRVAVFCTANWSSYTVGYVRIDTAGKIYIMSASSAVWSGSITYVRG